MKREKFIPYPDSVLPRNFKYPESYLLLSKDSRLLNGVENFPWWFEDGIDNLEDVAKIYEELTGGGNLIPFARDGDWAACFKGNDTSGNPRVYVYDLGNIENKYEVDSFDNWLEFVIKECSKI